MKSLRSTDVEEGAALLDTLIAILIFLGIIFAFWAFAGRATLSLVNSGKAAASAARASTLDRALRMVSARVRPPFWTGDAAFIRTEAEGNTDPKITIEYLDGHPSENLVIYFLNGKLFLETEGRTMDFVLDERPTIEAISEKVKAPTGLDIKFVIAKKPYHTRVFFGSVPLGPAEPLTAGL
jgi:hypothetical protein